MAHDAVQRSTVASVATERGGAAVGASTRTSQHVGQASEASHAILDQAWAGAVQRAADGETGLDDGEIQAVAGQGIAGGGGELPFRDEIERGFAPHDVRGIQAHVGGAAAQASHAIGAHAYATGDHVAFAEAPSLHLVAHEVAHVVQQRGGVQLSSAVGRAGDSYEQQADAVADRVARGDNGGELLGPARGGGRALIQRDARARAKTGLFSRGTVPEGGTRIDLELDVSLLPLVAPELGVTTGKLRAVLGFAGTTAFVAVSAGTTTLVARLDLEHALDLILGPAAAALPRGAAFIAAIAQHLIAVGSHVRIELGDKFVVIDLVRAVRGAWAGDLGGLRPVEAHLPLGKAGRVDVFHGDQVKAAQALPKYRKLGDLDLEDGGALRRNVLGLDDGGGVNAAVYFESGKLAVAILADKQATVGAVAEIDFAYLLEKLKKLGAKAGNLIESLLKRIKDNAAKVWDWLSGKLRFDLGGNFGSFLEFDFNLSLPRFGGGGGFHLGDLWPTSWSFDLPGFHIGALPRLKVPWSGWPKLGGFEINLPRLHDLFAGLGLPKLPALPHVDVDLHFEGLKLGFGIDLGKLWPDLDFGSDGSVFGFDFDLSALLDKLARLGGAIGRAARTLWDLLGKAGGAIKRWIHIGRDGVLRIFDGDDASPDKSMLGFSLLKLLDGADPSDLVPVEMRYHGPEAKLDLGADQGKPDEKKRPGQVLPARPAGKPVFGTSVKLPARVTEVMGLVKDRTAQVDVYWHGSELALFIDAAPEALRMSIELGRVRDFLVGKLPTAGKARFEPRVIAAADQMLGIEIVEPGADPKHPKAYARATWHLANVLAAEDLGGLEPEHFDIQLGDHFGVSRGPFDPPAGHRHDFDLHDKRIRRDVLLQQDNHDDVWVGIFYQDAKLALALTPGEGGHDGMLAHVDLVWLLHQLEKLGSLGERVLDGIAHLLGEALDGVTGFAAKLAKLAGKLGGLLPSFDNLHLRFGGKGGGFFAFDLSKLAGLVSFDGIDWSGLVPDFSGLELPGLPGLSIDFGKALGWLPDLKFATDHLLGSLSLGDLDLSKLFGGLPGIDWKSITGLFQVFGLDDLHLGISIDLSFLSFAGGRKLGLQIDLARVMAPFARAWEWLKKHFPKRISKALNPNVSLGKDGVLRLWDSVGRAKIGFDLKRLLDGFDASDLVPVEMEFEVTTSDHKEIATLEYGKAAKADEKPTHDHQVLAHRPDGKAEVEYGFAAPDVVREHLGAPKNAQIKAELFHVGGDAVLFATVSGTDRGMTVHVDAAAIAAIAAKLGPKTDATASAGHIDWEQVRSAQALVVTFGPQPKPSTRREDVKPHGRAVWKLSRFFDGIELGDLVPDDLHVETRQLGFDIGVGIDIGGLPMITSVGVPDSPAWIGSALGARAMEIHAGFGARHFKLALVAAMAKAGDHTPRRGVELEIDEKVIEDLEHRLGKLAEDASKKLHDLLKKSPRASKLLGGGIGTTGLHLQATGHGLRVEHGKEGDPTFMYATFGWSGLIEAVGDQKVSGLVPTEFRLATQGLSAEMKDVDSATGTIPKAPKRVSSMHPIFRDALGMFGLESSQYVELDLGKSPVTPASDGGHMVELAGKVYTPSQDPGPDHEHAEGVPFSHARELKVAVSLEAVLAQVLPGGRRKFDNQKDGVAQKKGVSLALGLKSDLGGGLPGVELDMKATFGRPGNQRSIEVHVGWTVAKLLEIVMNLGEIEHGDSLGTLTPDAIGLQFDAKLFTLAVDNLGKPVGTQIDAPSVPFLTDALGTFLDEKTAEACKLWLEVPDSNKLIAASGKALIHGERVEIGKAALEIPTGPGKPSRIYAVHLKASLALLEKLAGFIPELGIVVKALRALYEFGKDPKGSVESTLYSPEMAFHFMANFGAIYDKVKDMSIKDMVFAYLSDDSTTKEACYMARLREKLEAAGVHLDKNMTEDEKKKAATAAKMKEEELDWMLKQDPHTIEKAVEISKALRKLGLDKEEKPGDYTKPLDLHKLEDLQLAAEHGFTDWERAYEKQQKVAHDPNASQAEKDAAKKELDARAEAMEQAMAKRLAAGTTKVDFDAAEQKGQPSGSDPKSTPDVDNLADIKKPDTDQTNQARSLFQDADSGLDPVSASYLIQKYAFLSNDQLADLLATTNTRLTADQDPHQRIWHMPPEERDFVRALFVKRTDPQHKTFKKAPANGDAAQLDKGVADSWRRKQAAKAKQERQDGRKGKGGDAPDWSDTLDEAGQDALDDAGMGKGGDGGGKHDAPKAMSPDTAPQDADHLYGRVFASRPGAFVSFDKKTHRFDKQPDWKQQDTQLDRRAPGGSGAHVVDFTIADRGLVSKGSDTPVYHAQVTLTVEIDDVGTHTEVYDVYIDAEGNQRHTYGIDAAGLDSIQQAFRVHDGTVEPTGKRMRILGDEFTVISVSNVKKPKSKDKPYTFDATVKVESLDDPGSRIRNSDGEYVKLERGTEVTISLGVHG